MSAYVAINKAVREGRITAADGAKLMELYEAARAARRRHRWRRALWRGLREGAMLAFMPWRWRAMWRAWRSGQPYRFPSKR